MTRRMFKPYFSEWLVQRYFDGSLIASIAIIVGIVLTVWPASAQVLCPSPMVEVFNNGKGAMGKDDCLTRAEVEAERGRFVKTKAKASLRKRMQR